MWTTHIRLPPRLNISRSVRLLLYAIMAWGGAGHLYYYLYWKINNIIIKVRKSLCGVSVFFSDFKQN
jgi:hypothetical protein